MNKQKTSKTKKSLIVIGAFLFIVVIGIGVYLLFFAPKADTSDEADNKARPDIPSLFDNSNTDHFDPTISGQQGQEDSSGETTSQPQNVATTTYDSMSQCADAYKDANAPSSFISSCIEYENEQKAKDLAERQAAEKAALCAQYKASTENNMNAALINEYTRWENQKSEIASTCASNGQAWTNCAENNIAAAKPTHEYNVKAIESKYLSQYLSYGCSL